MRSVQVTKPNGPFEIVDRDIPEPDNKQVRIKIQACGVCHSDSFTKQGLFPGIVYPRVPGHEIAGIIDKVGDDVTQWEPGRKSISVIPVKIARLYAIFSLTKSVSTYEKLVQWPLAVRDHL